MRSTRKKWRGRLHVAVVYPDTYRAGAASLALHVICPAINSYDELLAERFFSDTIERGSIESGRKLAEFDLIIFSVPYEPQYLDVVRLLEASGLPAPAADRRAKDPVVLVGGAAVMINPRPVALIADLVALGEAEPIFDAMLPVLAGIEGDVRAKLRETLADLPGIYPAGGLLENRPVVRARRCGAGPVPLVQSPFVRPAHTVFDTRGAQFGDLFLIESTRGCRHRCRYCTARVIFAPPRAVSADVLDATLEVNERAIRGRRIGLVGLGFAEPGRLMTLGALINRRGHRFTIGSLRIDGVTRELAELLALQGVRTVTLAPEAGTPALRRSIGKPFTDSEITAAVTTLAAAGIDNIKLYFMLGLPGESDADVLSLAALLRKLSKAFVAAGRHRGRLGVLTAAVNPFVPKPLTPLAGAGLVGRERLRARYRLLRAECEGVPNLRLKLGSYRDAELEALLTSGGREAGELLCATGGDRRRFMRAARPLLEHA